MRYQSRIPETIFLICNYAFLAALAVFTFFPFWYMVINSISDPVFAADTLIWPKKFYYANYWIVFNIPEIWRALAMSVLRVMTGVPLMLVITGAAAFALTRKELLGRKILILIFFISMFLDGGLIPYYMVLKTAGLLNTFWVLVIPGAFSVWTMIVMKTSFQGLPQGLTEAARIDGAGYTRIYFSIIIPLSLPMFATLALFSAVGHWNEWFTGAFFINAKPKLWPLQTFIRMSRQNPIDILKGIIPDYTEELSPLQRDAISMTQRSLDKAITVFAMVPILLLYPWLQRYFKKGVLIGSIKE